MIFDFLSCWVTAIPEATPDRLEKKQRSFPFLDCVDE